MVTRTDTHPDVAIQLGWYLSEEIVARSISHKELVENMKRLVNTINQIINTKRSSQPRRPYKKNDSSHVE